MWIALDLAPRVRRGVRLDTVTRTSGALAAGSPALVFVQILLGALVAGLKAGLTYNTWPLMDGKLVPDGLLSMTPWYLNPFENITMVQFNHRVMAYVLLALAAGMRGRCSASADDERLAQSALVLLAALLGAGRARHLDAARGRAAVARHRASGRGGRGIRCRGLACVAADAGAGRIELRH